MASTSNEEELKSAFEIDNLKGYHHCDDRGEDIDSNNRGGLSGDDHGDHWP